LENRIILNHTGAIQYETIGELIHAFKQQIHAQGIQTGTYKKVLLIMIESLENIMKHSECCPAEQEGLSGQYLPVFSIRKNTSKFVITTSNAIRKLNTTAFRNKLDYLNGLDQQGLKDYYKETITNGQFTNRGGAGLGLIEIAKISGNKIVYEFLPLDEQCDRFNMIITINESIN
jgi:hypothetical protein